MNEPYEVVFDRAGNLFFTDMQVHAIRRIDRKTGIITTVAGTGEAGFQRRRRSRDQGATAATAQHRARTRRRSADLRYRQQPHPAGRSEDRASIATFAGTGEKKADARRLAARRHAAQRTARARCRRSRESLAGAARRQCRSTASIPRQKKIYHVAGTGEKGFTGDGGDAKLAKLNGPKGISWSPQGIFIADTENHAIRRLDEKTGVITTVAGTGTRGDGPDGRSA